MKINKYVERKWNILYNMYCKTKVGKEKYGEFEKGEGLC